MPYGTDSIDVAVEMAVTVFQKLGDVLTAHLGRKPQVASSYGYAAPSDDPEVLLDLMQQAIDACGYTGRIAFALDCASSEVFDKATGTYLLKGQRVSSDELIAYAKALTEKYPFVFIEDLLDENDWDGYVALTRQLGDKVQLVGDDFFVTNPARLAEGIEKGAANALLVKVNQIGTLSETLDAVRLADRNGYTSVMSHRSGETEDATIADLAVATNCGQIKTGSLARSDRLAKYNQLIRIEEMLGATAEYAGRSILR